MSLGNLKIRLLSLGIIIALAGGSCLAIVPANTVSAAALSVTTFAAPTTFKGCKHTFFGLVPWYEYMEKEFDTTTCSVKCFNLFNQSQPNECGQTRSDIPGILLAVIDDLLRIVGLVAIAFIMVASFQYIESRGNSERTARAQSTIQNALVGLIVAMVAVAFISFLGDRLGG